MLSDNIRPSLCAGAIAHQQRMDDMPPVGSIFFIADSGKKQILGPFVIESEQRFFSNGLVMCRKEPGIPDVYPVNCQWLTDFSYHPQAKNHGQGLPWNYASAQLGIPEESWKMLRECQLTPNQLAMLTGLLINETIAPDSINYLSDDIGIVEYLDLIEDDGCQWGPDGEPLNEKAYVELLYNGEWDDYRANEGE